MGQENREIDSISCPFVLKTGQKSPINISDTTKYTPPKIPKAPMSIKPMKTIGTKMKTLGTKGAKLAGKTFTGLWLGSSIFNVLGKGKNIPL